MDEPVRVIEDCELLSYGPAVDGLGWMVRVYRDSWLGEDAERQLRQGDWPVDEDGQS